jgi:hypothetical protein
MPLCHTPYPFLLTIHAAICTTSIVLRIFRIVYLLKKRHSVTRLHNKIPSLTHICLHSEFEKLGQISGSLPPPTAIRTLAPIRTRSSYVCLLILLLMAGRQNLACLSFAGGRAIPKRRRFYSGYDDKVLDDVTFRSFYTKVRNAANSAANAARHHLRASRS